MSDGLATDDDFIIKEKSTAFWDMVAQDYCSRVLQGWDGKDWICEVCKSMFPEDQPLRILDVGAGSGYVSAYLSKMGHDVTATDTSEEMLNQIIKLAAMENLDLQIIKDDIMNTNLHKASYDAIVMIDVLFCLPDVRKALHNCIDLLHPGGLLVILDGNYLLHLYSDEYSSRDAFYQMKNGRKESAEMLHLTEEEFLELSKIFGNSRINSTKRPK